MSNMPANLQLRTAAAEVVCIKIESNCALEVRDCRRENGDSADRVQTKPRCKPIFELRTVANQAMVYHIGEGVENRLNDPPTCHQKHKLAQ